MYYFIAKGFISKEFQTLISTMTISQMTEKYKKFKSFAVLNSALNYGNI